MPISAYLKELRRHVGSGLLLLPGVAAIIRDDNDRVLLEVRSDNGKWSLPAGAIDPGESPSQAIIREVYEETGLRVEPVAVVGVVGPIHGRYPNGDEVEYTTVVLACRVLGGTLRAVDGECIGFEWCPEEKLPDLGYPVQVFQWKAGDPALF